VVGTLYIIRVGWNLRFQTFFCLSDFCRKHLLILSPARVASHLHLKEFHLVGWGMICSNWKLPTNNPEYHYLQAGLSIWPLEQTNFFLLVLIWTSFIPKQEWQHIKRV